MTRPRVLIVDDEANVLKALERLLRREDFDVVTTTETQHALALAAEQEFAVVVSDQRMPQMTGTQLLEQMRKIAPNAVRITLTGYADKDAAIEAINHGAVHRFLTKPWDDQALKLEIQQAVNEHQLRAEVKRLETATQEQNRLLQEWNDTLEDKVEQRTAEISQLNKDLRTSLMTSVAVMARLGEMHSPIIGSHSQRVAALARSLATELNLDAPTINAIYAAALLHDIGKIGFSRTLLEKDPALFSDDERDHYRRHVLEGERIISLIPAIRDAAHLVRSHHERWNGEGFPDQLVGEEIPLGARIIAVADAYDNLLNSPLRTTVISPRQAMEQLVGASGTRFDPQLVKLLVEHLGRVQESAPSLLEIGLKDLKPGMKLAADVQSLRGVLLVRADTDVTETIVSRLKYFSFTDPIVEPLLIAC